MRGIIARGRIPLLVGGTMLYFRALQHGLSDLPPADPAIRARLRQELDSDRVAALNGVVGRYGGVVVLKGHGTLIGAAEELPWLVRRGNPGMASAGMGDVLTGVIAGFRAQYPDDPLLAAAAGVYAHATAGDLAAVDGERGLGRRCTGE